jgi:hypothetical protein
MKKDKWIWMPHPAHFIGGKYCQFKLATYVGKYIVSTVGEWEKDEIDRKFDRPETEEGKSRFKLINGYGAYETMVFEAKKRKENDKNYQCCFYEIIVEKMVDEKRYKTATEAYRSHLKLCNKWSKK